MIAKTWSEHERYDNKIKMLIPQLNILSTILLKLAKSLKEQCNLTDNFINKSFIF